MKHTLNLFALALILQTLGVSCSSSLSEAPALTAAEVAAKTSGLELRITHQIQRSLDRSATTTPLIAAYFCIPTRIWESQQENPPRQDANPSQSTEPSSSTGRCITLQGALEYGTTQRFWISDEQLTRTYRMTQGFASFEFAPEPTWFPSTQLPCLAPNHHVRLAASIHRKQIWQITLHEIQGLGVRCNLQRIETPSP